MPPAVLPPGPSSLLPWLGTTIPVFRNPLRWMLDLGLGYGPVSYTRTGFARMYMVNDPELIEEVLIGKHRECIKDHSTRQLRSMIGNGLLTSEGDPWRHARRLAAPPLQPKRIASYAHTMLECTQRALDGLTQDAVHSIDVIAASLTLEIAGRTLLGFDVSRDAERVSHVLDAAMEHFSRQFYSWHALLPRRVPTPTRRRYYAAVEQLDTIIYEVIARSRADSQPADHFLARLVHARGEDGETLSDVQLRDEAVTMLLAGHETTALTLAYACHSLASLPRLAARVHDEVDTVLGQRAIGVDDLPKLRLLDAVVRETLRLYPPAYIIGREVVQSFEIGGYSIPRGCAVLISPYTVHRDPRLHAEAGRFNPDRWLMPRPAPMPRFAYLPFGGGPRTCIGNHFALMETMIVLATLLQRFELHPVPGFRLRFVPAVTLRPAPGGVRVRLTRRPTLGNRTQTALRRADAV